MFEHIPEELKVLPQWVTWRLEEKQGRITKVPYNPTTHHRAIVTNAHSWGSFERAISALMSFRDKGIGFVFTQTDPYVGVDMDHCRDPQSGVIAEWAMTIINQLATYTEVSQSGTGLHCIVKGTWLAGRRCSIGNGGLEVYAHARYFVTTGNRLEIAPSYIRALENLMELLGEYFVAPHRQAMMMPPQRCAGDDEIVTRAAAARNGAKFLALWRGDISDYDGDESRADLALCNFLAYWTGNDQRRIDRLFRQSGLMRAKWDERRNGDGTTYGEMTMSKAIR